VRPQVKTAGFFVSDGTRVMQPSAAMTTERGHEIKRRGAFPGGRCGDARGRLSRF